MRIVTVTCLFLSLAAPAFAGKVWVVGPAPGQLHDLQDTIILAQDGDVILVKAGNYESIRTTGRSLTVVAEVGANVRTQGAIRVIDFPAGRTATFSGLSAFAFVSPAIPELNAGLYAKASGGQIVVQDCTLANPSTTPAPAAAYVEECSGLSIVRSTVRGYSGPLSICPPLNNTIGMRVGPGSFVDVQQSSIQAGPGMSYACNPNNHGVLDAPPAPPALTFLAPATGGAALVFASASQFVGGRGGSGDWQASIQSFCGCGGRGGDGIFGVIPNGQLVLLGVTSAGGLGGLADPFCPPSWSGPSGDPIYAGPWQSCGFSSSSVATPYTTLAGTPRSLSGSTLLRDDQPAILDFSGASGELVDIALSRRQVAFTYQPTNSGVLHIQNPVWRRVGSIPASGLLRKKLPLPDLPLSDPGATFFVQARFVDLSSGQTRLSNLHAVVEVDASY